MRSAGGVRRSAVVWLLASLFTACGGGDNGPPPLRQLSMSYAYVIKPDDSPPHARQDIHYVIQIVDTKTRMGVVGPHK
jgi:hypothetical protein